MANESKNPSQVLWNKRAAKRYVDELVFRCISSWKLPRKTSCQILCLPASLWFWEREFTTAFPDVPVAFTGIERNATVLRNMKKNAVGLNVLSKSQKFLPVSKPVELHEFLKTTDQIFDIMYLDWMGTWSTEKFNQIRTVMSRELIRKGGLLRLTMSLTRGKPKLWKPLCSEFDADLIGFQDVRCGGGELPDWKVYGIPELIVREAATYGIKLKIVSNIAYISRDTPTSRGTSEISVMFRRY